MRPTVVMPILLAFFFLWHALPIYADITRIPEFVVKDPQYFPKDIYFPKSLTPSELEILKVWVWHFMKYLPGNEVLISVGRSQPDPPWMQVPNIRIFLFGGGCLLALGADTTFEKAAESLARNLIFQGYWREKEELVLVAPLRCEKPKEQSER